jgi:transcriptional regulator with XRE-family HTH domain
MKRKKQQATTFGERLGELVHDSGLSQGEVARRAGVSPQVVSRLLMAGNADVTLSIACRLAWAMRKSVSEFEETVFEEWKAQPKTLELIGRELARGRLQQRLDATNARIADWNKALRLCGGDYAGKVSRRWMEGLIRHWQEKAQSLEERLRQLASGEEKENAP